MVTFIQVSKHHSGLKRWFDQVTKVPGFQDVLNISELKFAGNGKSKKAGNPPAVEVSPLKVEILSISSITVNVAEILSISSITVNVAKIFADFFA